MAHYEIRIQGPSGAQPIVMEVEHPDDMAALNSALEICRNQKIEIWDAHRQVGAVSLTGTPRLTL